MILVVVFASSAFSLGGKGEPSNCLTDGKNVGKMRQQHKGDLIKELSLSKEQVKALDKYREENSEKMKKAHAEIRKFHVELRKELTKPVLNEGKLNDLQDKILAGEKKAIENQTKELKEMRSILNPEQLKKLNARSEKFEEEMRKNRVERGLKGMNGKQDMRGMMH